MNGKQAFEYLKEMSVDEMESVNIIWFDRDTLRENLHCDTDEEYEMKSDEVDKLTNQEVGEILESSLYTYAGDIQKYFDDFLDKHDEIMTDKFNEYIS
jgi:hypothetical protein